MLTLNPPTFLAALGLIVLASAAFAADTAPATAKAAPTGLSATLIANKDSYMLDPAFAGQAFRDKLDAAKKANKPPPAKPPMVDLTLRITNHTDQAITLGIGGDQSRIALKLEGSGAVTVPNMVPMTREFRPGTPVTLDPGKSHDIAITSLAYGMRGVSEYAFWTEYGNYTLTASLVAAQGDKQVTITSDPVKIKVVEAGD